MPSAARSSSTPRTLSDHFEGSGKLGVGNGAVREGPGGRQRPDRYGRDAQVPRLAQFLQHRRLSREHLSRPQGRSVPGLFRPAAAVVEARRPMERGPAGLPRPGRYDRLLLHHSAQRRGERLQQLHHAAERERRHQPDPDQQPGHRTTATSPIRRSSSITTRDSERSRRSRTTTTPRRSTPETPTISGPSRPPSPTTTSSRSSRLPWAARSMRARASSSTRRPTARSCASPPTRSTASRGSRARITSTPSASSPPAIWWTADRASRPSIRLRWSIRPIRSRPTPTSRSSRTRRTTTPGRCLAMRPTSSTRSGSSMRRSATTEDSRQNTTDTPTAVPARSELPRSGEVRDATFDAAQPKGTLRYKPTDDLTFYGGWSRGFRSGGFNQTGVGAVAAADGQTRRSRSVPGRDRRYLGSGRQEPVPRPALERESRRSITPTRTTATSSSTTRPPRPRISAISTPRTKAPSSS